MRAPEALPSRSAGLVCCIDREGGAVRHVRSPRTMRFAVCAAAVVLVALTGARATSAHHAAALRDRTTTDMPDDIQGPQVHFMYVIASDDADGQLDTNGAFEQS